MTKLSNIFFKTLGLYQVVGGLYGLYILADAITLLNLIFLLPFILLLLISGGYLFLRVDSMSFKLSFFNQILQIFQFNFFGYGFMYASGIYLALAAEKLDFNYMYVNLRLWTFLCYFLFNSDDSIFLCALNFVPIIMMLSMTLFRRVQLAGNPPA